MFAEGQLLRFDPFIFKNGAPSKPKYYVVLKHMGSTGSPELGEDLMMDSLPTSQDHVPEDLAERTGCVNFPERCVNAYVFAAGEQVTDIFAFPLRTYVYGEQVDEYSQIYLDKMGANIEDLGLLPLERLEALRQCLKQSPLIKRKYYRLL